MKGHPTVRFGVQSIVLAEPDVTAGVEACAALANQDVPGAYGLASEALDSQALGDRVATVAAAAARLLVCHNDVLLRPYSLWMSLISSRV
jgi:hypothetical protein